MKISIPVSPGEILDKLSILEIKEERISDEAKRDAAIAEAILLEEAIGPFKVWDTPNIQELYVTLDTINRKLWDVEDELRVLEQKQDFGKSFIDLARSVYKLNDDRARMKRLINATLGSEINEVKSYV